MTLMEKIEEEFPLIRKRLEKLEISRSTENLDKILYETNGFKLNFTKLSSDFTYESFINETYELDRFFRLSRYDHHEMDFDDLEMEGDSNLPLEFFKKDIPEGKNFLFELSDISDIFIAHITNYMVASENSAYLTNFNRFILFQVIRPYPRMEEELQVRISFEDLLIRTFKRRFRTLKIKSREEKTYREFKNFKNSYLIDFMFNYNIPLTTQTKDQNRLFIESEKRTMKNLEEANEIISPKLIYDSNLVIYFKKAMSSTDVSTKYLSFYHIIEYNFDSLYNADIISKMRAWLIDPQISLSEDESILKFVDKARKLKGKSTEDGQGNEFDAFLLVLEKLIDLDKLKSKLEDFTKERMKQEYQVSIIESNMLDYYKKNSVEFLGDNLKIDFNNENAVLKNIRTRIYETRNSLVHSKDNYKLKTYHPYDDERSLIKEIPLIKVVAIEIMLNSSKTID